MKLRTLVLASLLLVAPAAHAIDVQVTDGDTFTIDGQTIRLWGVEAPEQGQECQRNGRPWFPGPESIRALKEILAKVNELACTTRDVDRLGRSVATCQGNGEDIGTLLVSTGWAYDFFEYSGGFYVPREAEARNAKLGLWAGECAAPWRWRQIQRQQQRQPRQPQGGRTR